MDQQRVVITIHGIRTDGAWQDAAEQLLSPYFLINKFRYDEYRHSIMSVVWLALELIGVLVSVAVMIWLYRKGYLDSASRWAIALLGSTSFWLACRYFAKERRDRVLEEFRRFFTEKRGSGLPPHIIAHSLGTLLVGMLLDKFDDVRMGTVILNGCVLSRRFPWKDFVRRCEHVRNEMACKDLVSKFASLLQGIIPSMGQAGAIGFRVVPAVVSKPRKPAELECSCALDCATGAAERTTWVDNIRHDKLGHSDYHIGTDHQEYYWLPTLWGFSPVPFWEFLDKCQEGLRYLPPKADAPEGELAYQTPSLDTLERELRSSCWGWAGGTLGAYLLREWEYVLRNRPVSAALVEDLSFTSLRMLWTKIGKDRAEGKAIANPEEVFLAIKWHLLEKVPK